MKHEENFEKFVDSLISDLHNLKNNIPEDYKNLVDYISFFKGRVVLSGVGKSGYISKKISASFSSVGVSSFFIHPVEAMHGDLGMITKDDIVILLSNSGKTPEIYGLVHYCKSQSIKLAGITSNSNSFLYKSSDYRILMPSISEFSHVGAPCNSTCIMLAIGDALMIDISSLRKFQKEDFHKFHPHGNIGNMLRSIKDVMQTDVAMLKPETNMIEAMLEISRKKLGCGIVANEERGLLGVITDGDIRRHIEKISHLTASDVMTRSPQKICEDAFVKDGITVMEDHKITNLVVVDKTLQKVLGVVNIHMLLS